MSKIFKIGLWLLLASVCCLLDGCNCRARVSTKKASKDAPTIKRVNTFTLKMPGRVVKVVADVGTHVNGDKGDAILSFDNHTLTLTKSAIYWNGQEVSKLASSMTALEVKILKKSLSIAAGETVLFETGF